MTETQGEIFDLGYQRYDGPREGRARARKALWVNGVRTALGLGRGGWAKAPSLILFFAAMTPAVVLGIIASQVGDGPVTEGLPGHADYYQIVSIILLLFSAIIAPELLCPDRRDGVLNLYLVRPLTTTDYLAGRWVAFLSVTLALVYSGQVLLLFGLTLADDEPFNYLRENWLDIPRFLAAGLVVALYTTSLPMAVAGFTTRRAYAAAFVIGLSVISFPVAAGLTECPHSESGFITAGSFGGVDPQGNWTIGNELVVVDEQTRIASGLEAGDVVVAKVEYRGSGPPVASEIWSASGRCRPLTGNAAKYLALIDLFRLPIHLSDMIFADENESSLSVLVAELPKIVPIGWYLLLTVGPALLLWGRYRRIGL